MIIKVSAILFLVFIMACTPNKVDEYRGKLGEGGGEYSIGQSTSRYHSGNFIVYGGDAKNIYYMVFSEAPWSSIEAFDYPPNSPKHKEGCFEFIKDGKATFFPFQSKQLLLLWISKELLVSSEYIQVTPNEWRDFMQPYTNSIKDSDYNEIKDFFKNKTDSNR